MFFSLGIGIEVNGIENLHISLKTAQKAVALYKDYGNKSVIFADETLKSHEDISLSVYTEQIKAHATNYKLTDLLIEVGNIFSLIISNNYSLFQTRAITIDILLIIYRSTKYEDIIHSINSITQTKISDIMLLENIDDIKMYMEEEITVIFQNIDDVQTTNNASIFQNIIDYINKNYANQNLSRNLVAKELYISSSYVSIYLKKYIMWI